MEKASIREFKNIDVGIETKPSYGVLLQESSSARKIASIQGNTNIAGYACIGMAESYRRLGKVSSAAEEYRNALAHFSETKNITGLAWANWSGANISRQQGDYKKSVIQLKKSVYYSHVSREIDCEHYSVAGLAESTRILGDYGISYRQHLYAYKLFLKQKDFRGVVWAYEGVAQILKNTGHIDQAARLFSDAIMIARQISDIRGLGYALKCFGECCALQGNHAKGLHYMQNSKSIFHAINHKTGLAYLLKATADIYRDSYQYDKALDEYDKADLFFSEIRDRRGMAYVAASRGILSLKNKNFGIAARYLKRSMEVFEKKNIRYGKAIILAALREEKYIGDELRCFRTVHNQKIAEQSHALGQQRASLHSAFCCW